MLLSASRASNSVKNVMLHGSSAGRIGLRIVGQHLLLERFKSSKPGSANAWFKDCPGCQYASTSDGVTPGASPAYRFSSFGSTARRFRRGDLYQLFEYEIVRTKTRSFRVFVYSRPYLQSRSRSRVLPHYISIQYIGQKCTSTRPGGNS